jgi:hypothetical protein
MTAVAIPPTIFDASDHDLDAVSTIHSTNYSNNIESPEELGITADAANVESNIAKLITYDDILIGGSKTGPLGSKYFAPTGGKCRTGIGLNNIANRSLYINSVRSSETPGGNQGLIPSITTDLQEINPYNLYTALSSSSTPNCSMIEMNTTSNIDATDTVQSGYVADSEIRDMNACWFPDKTNPLTNETCVEGFSNISSEMPDDTFMKAYFFSLGILGFYILTKIVIKKS